MDEWMNERWKEETQNDCTNDKRINYKHEQMTKSEALERAVSRDAMLP